MKTFYLIPLLFLAACSTPPPRIALQPQPPPLETNHIRYPETVRAYHVGRYADPNDDLVMHEQHVVYRVEQNTRWDLRPSGGGVFPPIMPPRDAAFSPSPVNDAVLAEINAQKLATIQIMVQAKALSAALAQFQTALQQTRTNFQETAVLRASVIEMKKRLDTLDAAPPPPPLPNFPTNDPSDSLSP